MVMHTGYSSLQASTEADEIMCIHTYIWGATKVNSEGGAMYIITFVGDCSRYV